MLEEIQIAAPCKVDWDRMEGTDRVRFCPSCQRNVFDLSAMTRRDAEALLAETKGNLCARLYRRADGVILTQDYPVGLRRRIGLAAAGILSLATAWAQEPGPLSGRIVDSAGAVISNAVVKITNAESGQSIAPRTGSTGRVQFTAETAGVYNLSASSPGFVPFSKSNVSLSPERRARLDITLQVGEMMLGVVVTAAPAK